MVANVGNAAVSAVSLVDSINNLMLMIFVAVATGGTIACAQYLGRQDVDGALRSAGQLLLCVTVISVLGSFVCVILRVPLLMIVFGSVDTDVMEAALRYFLITALSYPFIAIYSVAAALFRAQGNAKTPLLVATIGNILNVIGNATFIFVFRFGVMGAALSTLASRIFQCVLLMCLLRQPNNTITLRNYFSIRPDLPLIHTILRVGIPTGVENGMFQLGRLVIQSTVATLSTTEIAAQAVINSLEYFTSLPALAVGIGLVTVAGQCMGAGRPKEAKRYTLEFIIYGELLLIVSAISVFLAAQPVCNLSGLSEGSTAIVVRMLWLITLVKPVVWVFAFIPANTLRAAGDVRYSMLVSACSMWIFRICLCMLLVRGLGFGLIGVWIAMFIDWTDRGIWYMVRFLRGKWMTKHVLNESDTGL